MHLYILQRTVHAKKFVSLKGERNSCSFFISKGLIFIHSLKRIAEYYKILSNLFGFISVDCK